MRPVELSIHPQVRTMQDSSSRSPALLTAARLSAISLAVLVASGCTVLQEDKIDYKSAKRGTTLDVPPDLTQLSQDNRYAVPGVATASASGQQAAQAAGPSTGNTAINALGDVRIERSGGQRWLVVKRPADRLWTPVTDFWKENGFVLETEQEKLGIMETDWAENRAKIPQDFIRAAIGKIADGLYSSGERDRFRTRLERGADGATEIYISHRGMEEVYTSSSKEQTVWQPRANDPELEAEFLRRMMLKLGASPEQAKAAIAAAPSKQSATITSDTLSVDEGFDLAWRRVGLALDRTGFTVEDRDRTQGVYFVRYVPANAASGASKLGLLSRLFGGDKKEAAPAKYQLKLVANGNRTVVSVLNAEGQPAPKADAERIVKLLADDLN
jgi:outer membrane protein assembly factor BamC